MTVYISGGITDVPDFKERFKKAERHLRGLGFNVINPAGLQDNVTIGDFTHYDYMNFCIGLLELSDCVYFLDNWEQSDGAKTEMRQTRLLNKKIVKEDEERTAGKRVWSGCN